MPIPRPRKDESQDDFGSRCMAAIGGEYEDKDQAYAICMDTYRESKKARAGNPRSDDERCMEHFGLSPEEWGALSDEEKQEYRNKLPKRGNGLETEKSDEDCGCEKLVEGCTRLISKSDDSFIIGGYANVFMLDSKGRVVPDYENEVVTLDALDEALQLMMAEPSRRNNMYYHTNIQIGEVIWDTTDGEGVTWKTHVVREPSTQYPKKGLFILCKLYSDTPPSKEARRLMEEEGKLLSFSIGGLPIAEERKCDSDKCWTEITQLYLAEVTSCDKGMNAESKAFILKQLSKQPEGTPTPLPESSNKQNNYIGETGEKQLDDTEGAADSSDGEQTQKTRENEIAEEPSVTEGVVKEEKTLDNEPLEDENPEVEPVDEEENPVTKAPEVNEPEADAPEELEEPEVEEPAVEKIGEPKREDFDTADAFFKAFKDWFDAEKAKEPVTMKMLDEKLDALKEEILKGLGNAEVDGTKLLDIVKKSVRVNTKQDDVVIDMDKKKSMLLKHAAPRADK